MFLSKEGCEIFNQCLEKRGQLLSLLKRLLKQALNNCYNVQRICLSIFVCELAPRRASSFPSPGGPDWHIPIILTAHTTLSDFAINISWLLHDARSGILSIHKGRWCGALSNKSRDQENRRAMEAEPAGSARANGHASHTRLDDDRSLGRGKGSVRYCTWAHYSVVFGIQFTTFPTSA